MKKQSQKKSKRKIIIRNLLILLLIIYLSVFFFNLTKPLPEGISIESEIYNISEQEIDFLYDLTYFNKTTGEKISEQEVFDSVFNLVNNANRFIILDMFLFNKDYSEQSHFRPLTSELKDSLIKKKLENPNIDIHFTTDEINNFYGSYTANEIQELRDNDIPVIITKMERLRDSNPSYSALWRILFQPFGTSGEGWIKHPLGNSQEKVTLRSILKVFNAKSNHRKLIIADSNSEIHTIVTSGNPHDASSRHSNVAFLIKEDIWQSVYESEEAVARFSGTEIPKTDTSFVKPSLVSNKDLQVQFLTEGKIRSNLIKDIDSTEEGESIDLATFYFSDRKIISSLLKASNRGVSIRIVLDPNKDAFAREKSGVPNRPAAYELVKKSKGKIKIRWYETKGEQFHTKLIIINKKGKTIVHLGSANYTKRNLGDLNLEADIKLISPEDKALISEISEYFENIYNNKKGNYTLDFEDYKDTSKLRYFQYRIQEFTGKSTF
ncbi:phospholipase [Candidatus Pacearchaeota archaeon]|nr:phospholipase [Candidatus Pacearchaeota archaeon]|tara:strand:- start:1064 stop:2542 length:1479 start_codon:yes stop_codon:yes gene_type:complete